VWTGYKTAHKADTIEVYACIRLKEEELCNNLKFCTYFAVSSGKPDHRTVGGHTLLFLRHSWLIVAVNSWTNVDDVAVCNGAVDVTVLCAVAALN